MKALSVRLRIIISIFLTIGLVLIFMLEFTDWHQLDAVTLDGEEISDWEIELGFKSNKKLLDQPLEHIADQLLKSDGIARVDISYDLPGKINIVTNRFEPACLLLDKVTGRILGLNYQGRVVPLPNDFSDWEKPLLTSVNAGKLFELCSDTRVTILMPQLNRLKDDNLNLFRLINEIDFSSSDELRVTISGLSFELKTNADSFHERISGFIQFIEGYQPDLSTAISFNLRFANMIIEESENK